MRTYKRTHRYFYTPEQENWIKENVDNYINGIQLTYAFNSVFGTNKKPDTIKSKIHHLLPEHCYPWSGGQVKGRGVSVTAREIGEERITAGYTYIKIAKNKINKNFTTEQIRENWVQKHRWIYENAHGEIPKGSLVVFLDSDQSNFNIENLYCIPRRITIPMIRNNWFSTNPEVTLSAIKWCELFYTLKGEGDEN